MFYRAAMQYPKIDEHLSVAVWVPVQTGTTQEARASSSLYVVLHLLPNPQRFHAIVDHCLFEPRMLQRLLRRDPVLRIVHEDPLQEV